MNPLSAPEQPVTHCTGFPEPRPLRVLHVVFSLEPGGMENGLVNIARSLTPSGFHFGICCLERRGEFASRLPPEVTVDVLGKPPGVSAPTVARLWRVIRAFCPDVIHTHNLGPLIYTVLATGFGHSHAILHGEHGTLLPEESGSLRRFVRRMLHRCCRRVHTVGASLRNYYIAEGFPAGLMEVIVNGVDAERFACAERTEVRRRLGLRAEGRLMGMVGSFAPRKRHHAVLDAFRLIMDDLPDLEFVIVGTGGTEQKAIRERLRAENLEGRVRLAGYQEDPRPFYQAFNLLVVASNCEGLSNATLEAMSCGTPVLAHDACGSSDAITHGVDGYVFRVDTAQQLAGYLRRALADVADLEAMGARARDKVVRQFSLSRMIREYVQLYRSVAGCGQVSPKP